eukprot:g2838.t1
MSAKAKASTHSNRPAAAQKLPDDLQHENDNLKRENRDLREQLSVVKALLALQNVQIPAGLHPPSTNGCTDSDRDKQGSGGAGGTSSSCASETSSKAGAGTMNTAGTSCAKITRSQADMLLRMAQKVKLLRQQYMLLRSDILSMTSASCEQIVLLVGLPGAGKSYLCAEVLRRCPPDVEICLYDYDATEQELSFSLQGTAASGATASTFDPDKWREARDLVLQRVRGKVEQAAEKQPDCTAAGKRIHLLDDNFYLRSMRKPFWQLAREHRCQYKTVSVEASVESCLLRNSQRTGRAKVPDAIVLHMAEVLEWPHAGRAGGGGQTWENKALNFWYVSELDGQDIAGREDIHAGTTSSVDAVLGFIFQADESAIPAPREEASSGTISGAAQGASPASNAVARLRDLLESSCRKLVSRALETVGAGARKQIVAQRLGVVKKERMLIGAHLKRIAARLESEHKAPLRDAGLLPTFSLPHRTLLDEDAEAAAVDHPKAILDTATLAAEPEEPLAPPSALAGVNFWDRTAGLLPLPAGVALRLAHLQEQVFNELCGVGDSDDATRVRQQRNMNNKRTKTADRNTVQRFVRCGGESLDHAFERCRVTAAGVDPAGGTAAEAVSLLSGINQSVGRDGRAPAANKLWGRGEGDEKQKLHGHLDTLERALADLIRAGGCVFADTLARAKTSCRDRHRVFRRLLTTFSAVFRDLCEERALDERVFGERISALDEEVAEIRTFLRVQKENDPLVRIENLLREKLQERIDRKHGEIAEIKAKRGQVSEAVAEMEYGLELLLPNFGKYMDFGADIFCEEEEDESNEDGPDDFADEQPE